MTHVVNTLSAQLSKIGPTKTSQKCEVTFRVRVQCSPRILIHKDPEHI
jgi:hypothetical protein